MPTFFVCIISVYSYLNFKFRTQRWYIIIDCESHFNSILFETKKYPFPDKKEMGINKYLKQKIT